MPNNIRRQLSAIPTKEMRKIGILEPPEIYLRKYVDSMVKKVEYEKRGGHKRVNELLDQISNPTDRERARNAVKAMLGKTDGTMPNWYRKTQSVILAWNIVTLLAFAALNLQDPRLHELLNKPNTGLSGLTYRLSKLISASRLSLIHI